MCKLSQLLFSIHLGLGYLLANKFCLNLSWSLTVYTLPHCFRDL